MNKFAIKSQSMNEAARRFDEVFIIAHLLVDGWWDKRPCPQTLLATNNELAGRLAECPVQQEKGCLVEMRRRGDNLLRLAFILSMGTTRDNLIIVQDSE